MDWQTFQNSCCSLDLETNENGEIFALGAVFNDKTFQRKAPFNIQKMLAEFDVFTAADKQPPLSRIRENADLLAAIKQSPEPLSKASDWLCYLDDSYGSDSGNIWLNHLKAMLQDWQAETDDGAVLKQQTLEFLYDVLAEQRRERCLGQGVFLSTVHSVKGMEFSHLAILDGGWVTPASEEQRRLYYVAMTRAKETLCLIQRQDQRNPFLAEISGDHLFSENA